MARQLQPQQPTAAAQTGHHGADRDSERLRRFAITEPVDIHQQDERPEVLGQAVECRLHGLGGQGVRRWRVDEQRRLTGRVQVDQKRLARSFPVLSGICEKQDLVEPGAAVRACFEAMERPPRLQIGFLQQVFAGVGAAAEARRDAEQLSYVHQGRPVEFFPPLMRDAEHSAPLS
jgi:hypothetical protein